MSYLTQEEIPIYTLIDGVTMKEIEAASFLIDAFKGMSFVKQTYTERVRFIKTPKLRKPFEPFRGKLKHLPRIQVNDVRTTIRTIFNPVDVLVFEPQVLDFDEDTSPVWQRNLNIVNKFIRTQPHIDAAAALNSPAILPTYYGMDGLHGDIPTKKIYAQAINDNISQFIEK